MESTDGQWQGEGQMWLSGRFSSPKIFFQKQNPGLEIPNPPFGGKLVAEIRPLVYACRM